MKSSKMPNSGRRSDSPPPTTSGSPSRRPIIDDFALDDPLVLEAALALSASLLALPVLALPLATLQLLALALDVADAVAALAADLLGERD